MCQTNFCFFTYMGLGWYSKCTRLVEEGSDHLWNPLLYLFQLTEHAQKLNVLFVFFEIFRCVFYQAGVLGFWDSSMLFYFEKFVSRIPMVEATDDAIKTPSLLHPKTPILALWLRSS